MPASRMPKKQRSIIAKQTARKRLAKFTPQQLSAIAKKGVAKKPFALMSLRIKAGKAAMSPAKMKRAARKAAMTRVGKLSEKQRRKIGERLGKARMAGLSPAERKKLASNAGKAFWAGLSPEEITRIQKRRGKKSGQKRRLRSFKELAYVENLPAIRKWEKKKMEAMFKIYERTLRAVYLKYERRRDFEEIKQEIYWGFVQAMAKWDGKIPLTKLVRDSASLELIKYFSRLKGYTERERPIQDDGI